MKTSKTVLIVIPCFNEEKSIVSVVNQVVAAGYDYVVVNDCSTDKSLEVLKENNINHINLPNNLGIGGAMQAGYKWAYRNNYDVAVQFDGDGQHNAAYISTVVDPVLQGEADMVIGSRFVEGASKETFQSTRSRRIGIKIISSAIKLLGKGTTIHDVTSGLRAVNREVIAHFTKSYPQEYPEPLTTLQLLKGGHTVSEVPVSMNEREHGTSSISGFSSIYYMVNVVLQLFVVPKMIKGKYK